MRRWTLFGAWALVLGLTTTLTWQIVSAADDRVNDRPVAVNIAAPTVDVSGSPPFSIAAGANTTLPELEPSDAVTTVTTGETTPTTGPTTPTTEASSTPTKHETTTPTTSEEAWSYETVPTKGGTVVLAYRAEEVVLQTATPAPGYNTEVKKDGPPEVEVEFESNETKIQVKAEWKEGALDVKVSEESSDDD